MWNHSIHEKHQAKHLRSNPFRFLLWGLSTFPAFHLWVWWQTLALHPLSLVYLWHTPWVFLFCFFTQSFKPRAYLWFSKLKNLAFSDSAIYSKARNPFQPALPRSHNGVKYIWLDTDFSHKNFPYAIRLSTSLPSSTNKSMVANRASITPSNHDMRKALIFWKIWKRMKI